MADVEAQIHSVPEYQPDLESTTANPQRPQHPHSAASPLAATTANPQTTYLIHPRPPNSAFSQPQVTGTNGRPQVNFPPSQTVGIQGEKYGDSSDAVWSMYLTEAEKQDKDVIESWKGDTDGILVFTGLFSATVATFIVESYQNLSPNPTDTTNALLGQITQQLVNISSGTPVTILPAQSNQPFKPTASAVRVNVLWFASLVLSLTCALSATLMQQWARRYKELAQHHGAPHRRGRIRAYIFDGIRKFGMARAVATMPLLLHISVFLFFAGLVEFLFPTDSTVSYTTLGLVVAFALAYGILTVSPLLYLNCPYATPLSGVTWRLSQLFAIVGLKTALGIEALFHNPIFKLWSRLNWHAVAELSIESWTKALKDKVKLHRHRFSGGLRKSIERNANEASPMVVPSALEWTLTSLDEDKEIEKFAAGVPGLFDSHTIPDTTILSLISITDAIFGFRLYDLLKTCLLGTSLLDDEDRKSRLRVCLKCLWYFGRAYHKLQTPALLPSYFPLTVVSPEIIQRIQIEPDPLSRVIGHCFGALIVTKLAADIRSRTNSNVPLEVSDDELACVSTFLNADRRDVTFCLECPGAIELACMASIAFGALDTFRTDDVKLDALTLGQETLDILSRMAELHLDRPITQLNISDGKFDRIIVLPLLSLFQSCIVISGNSDLAADLRRSCLRMSLRSLWYCAKAYHQSGASKPFPSHFPLTLANPEIIRRIRVEEDPASRVMGCCFYALVVTKLAADARSRSYSNVQIGDDELACLSIILGIKSDDVKFCLERSGAIELVSMVSLALGDLGALGVSTLPPGVLDVAHQTLTILSQALPAGEAAGLQLDRPLAQLDISNGEFDRAILSRLLHLLRACFMISGTPPLTAETRRSCLRMCLMSLWYCAKAYHQLGPSKLLPAYFFVEFSTPEIIRHIRTERDPISYVIGRCFQALVVSKGAAYIKSRADSDVQLRNKVLTCLSAILDIGNDELRLWLEQRGAIELLSLVFLAFDDASSFGAEAMPLYTLDLIPRTFGILSQALPTEINTEPGLYQIDAQADNPDGTAPTMGEIYRNHAIGCLKGLWYHLRAYSQPGNSVLLPSYVLFALTSPAWTRRIRTERGVASRVIGRCAEALVIKDLVAGVKPSTNSSVQVRDNKLAWLSAVLGTESSDVKLCLECHGAIEFTTMVSLALGDVGSSAVSALPSDVREMAQQTLAILADTAKLFLEQPITQLDLSDARFDRIIVSGFHKLLHMCKPDTSPLLAEVRRSCLRMCLKILWYCAQAYHRPGTSKPLPSYFPNAFATEEIILISETEQDPVSCMVGRCFVSLVVLKLVADARSRNDSYFQLNNNELDCLRAFFNSYYDFNPWRTEPEAIELIIVVFFACGDSNFLAANTARAPRNVLDVIPQTFNILSQALPAEINSEPGFNQIYSHVNVPPDGTASTIGEIYRKHSIKCLKNLWCRLQAYHQPGTPVPLPSYVLIAFDHPNLVNCLSGARDIAIGMMGRCINALVVNEPIAGVTPSTSSDDQIHDRKMPVAWFRAILEQYEDDVKFFLQCPGAAVLASMVSIVPGAIGSLDDTALPSDVRDVAQQTLAILAQKAKLHLDQPITPLDISDAAFERIIVFGFRNLLRKCIPGASTLTSAVRRGCLRISLTCLWYCAKAYQHLDASEPSSAYFFSTLGVASPDLIHLIQNEQDSNSRVTGRCTSALVVMKLMADIRSRTISNVQIRHDKLACLSTILGAESHELKLWLSQPHAVELANIISLISSEIDLLFSDTTSASEVMIVMQQTYSILTRTLPAELNAKLTHFTDWTLPEPMHRSQLRRCLENLWHCARAYDQLRIAVPLPSFVRTILASPEFTRGIHAERDLTTRVTGRCVQALIVNKLVDDFQSRTSFRGGAYAAELARISSLLGTKPGEFSHWPPPSAIIKLQNAVSLVSGEIEDLFTSSTAAAGVTQIVQQTLDDICSDLILRSAFDGGDLHMSQVSLLRDMCSKIANTRPATNRFRDETVGLLQRLQQISKQLPTVERKMRRCTSSIFDPQSVRGRSISTTRPESRRRSKSV